MSNAKTIEETVEQNNIKINSVSIDKVETKGEKETQKKETKETKETKGKKKEETPSHKKVQEITLEYLMNHTNNNGERLFERRKEVKTKDKKFYRKRIIQLTKDLLAETNENETEPNKDISYSPDIYNAFQTYIKACVDYFKTVDRTDLLQKDYQDLVNEKKGEIDNDLNIDFDLLLEEKNVEEANKYLMTPLYNQRSTLDGLVKRKVTKKEDIILPQLKKINLKDPELKNKGVCKKNNLNNN